MGHTDGSIKGHLRMTSFCLRVYWKQDYNASHSTMISTPEICGTVFCTASFG